ncbi:hypothetical protein CGRA01v4_09675 [Colletotrichum graminicola]|nr:hypothetical protein CGRA01v4_09675 [Colletotrichum graminicola]
MVQFSFLSLLLGLAVLPAETQSLPKQLAAVRRRSGLTHAEYLQYLTLVHGQKSWNAPRDSAFPLAYTQNYVFDSVFGANNSVGNQAYVGRDSIIELYSSIPTSFIGPPPSNYTETVIGPDGENFSDMPVAMSTLATETFLNDITHGPASAQPKDNTAPLVAFFWAIGTKDVTSNETFARYLADALIKPLPAGILYNASYHVPVPGADLRPYYGGQDMPIVNAVIKMWLNESVSSMSEVRSAQTQLNNSQLHLDENLSFMMFSKEVTVWDTTANISVGSCPFGAFGMGPLILK